MRNLYESSLNESADPVKNLTGGKLFSKFSGARIGLKNIFSWSLNSPLYAFRQKFNIWYGKIKSFKHKKKLGEKNWESILRA